MKYMVTGAAGFIGSHLCEKLLGAGHEVVAVDCFTDYYARALKEKNAEAFKDHGRCKFIEADVNDLDLADLVKGCQGVYHLAAQAGVRASWGKSFEHYLHHNVRATQRFLEAVKDAGGPRLVYASSSSVYGDTAPLPAKETNPTRPRSPYGVSKLACEHLADLYRANFGVDAIGLRYFTVYGPRQRPDMAFNRFIRALFHEREITVYGDGRQSRDFTFIADIVEGTVQCMEKGVAGRAYNIGGGHRTVLIEAIEALAAIMGVKARIRKEPVQKGDVRDTSADTSLLRAETGFAPATRLEDGLRAQAEWQKEILKQE